MIELVLNEDVYVIWKFEREIIRQMGGIVSPGQGNDFHGIALPAQKLNKFPIVQISAAQGIERAIDY